MPNPNALRRPNPRDVAMSSMIIFPRLIKAEAPWRRRSSAMLAQSRAVGEANAFARPLPLAWLGPAHRWRRPKGPLGVVTAIQRDLRALSGHPVGTDQSLGGG